MTNKYGNPERPRLCFALRQRGATVYGNRPALRMLIERLQFIVTADPAEHFESHVFFDLDPDHAFAENPDTWNTWVLAEKELHRHIAWPGPGEVVGEQVFSIGFDFNIMAVTEADLDELSACRTDGILPPLLDED